MRPRRTVRKLPPFPAFAADVLGLDPKTRGAQLAIQKAIDGLPLDESEAELFTAYTGGLERPRPDGYNFALVLVGRQGGKTESAAARIVYEAVAAVLSGERDVACVGISQDARAAQRVLFGVVERFFDRPLLRGLVRSRTAESILLDGNVRVMVLPCRPAAIRGLRCRCVVLDEICHFRSSENQPLDREAWRAALPTLLTTRGRIMALSSPYGAAGLAFDLHKRHFGVDSDVLVWQSPSYVLHPDLDQRGLDRIREVDPEGAEAEIEGHFLANLAALLDDDTLEAAVDPGVTVRPRTERSRYRAFVDVATGTRVGGDRWTAAVAHADGKVAVLDALLLIPPPFSPASAARQTADLLASYGIRRVEGDRFAAGFSDEAFRAAGLELVPSEKTKSDLYVNFAAAIQSGAVRLLDDPVLIREARGLERRRGATKDRVDHRRGAHDDLVNAAAGALVACSARQPTFSTAESASLIGV